MDYIAEIEGDYYEGTNVKLRLMSSLSPILGFGLCGYDLGREHIFVEDYFNSSTRIRRGRLYVQSNYKSWRISNVTPRPICCTSDSAIVNSSYSSELDMNVIAKLTPGKEVFLGGDGIKSYWTVILSEKTISGAYSITLKSKTFLGVLPELLSEEIPVNSRNDIHGALNAVVEASSVQAPQPVIDACRNAASHMISAQFPDSNPGGSKDLGKLVKWLIEQGRLKKCTDAADSVLYLLEASSSHLVNQLHSRGKANAAATHGTRPVSQRDADLAVSAIAFLLQDFGWAIGK